MQTLMGTYREAESEMDTLKKAPPPKKRIENSRDMETWSQRLQPEPEKKVESQILDTYTKVRDRAAE